MLRRVTFHSVILILLANLAVGIDKSKAKVGNPEDDGPAAKSVVLSTSMPPFSHSLKLIDSQFLADETDLIPTDPDAQETLASPDLLAVDVPQSSTRTHLFICANGFHGYNQVPSNSPLRFTGSYRVRFSSSVLPDVLEIGLGLGGIQREFVPSTQHIRRNFDPAGCFVVDAKVLASTIQTQFSITPAQAQQLAADLLHSQTRVSMGVQIIVRSVSDFELFNAQLAVFGD